jgi:hypothetical protein
MEQIKDAGFEQLRFGNWRNNAQRRFARKEHRAFRYRPHVAGEPQFAQPLRKPGREPSTAVDPREFLLVEACVLQLVQYRFKAGDDHEPPLGRQRPHEQLEYRDAVHPVLPIPLQHRQLVEIGQQQRAPDIDHGWRTASASAATTSSSES